MSKLGECRRVVSMLGIILLLLSMLGDMFPWLSITDSNDIYSWYFVKSSNINEINNDNDISSVKYNMDIYFGLFNAQTCSTFISGELPLSSTISTDLTDKTMCISIPYKDINTIVLDTHNWDNYSKKCSQNGIICAVLILIGIVMFCIVNIITICCNIDSKTSIKGCLCGVSFFIPAFIFMGIFTYFIGCMEANAKEILSDFHRTRKSGLGVMLAIIGGIFITFWWILFLYSLFKKQKHTFKFKERVNDDSDDDDDKSISAKPTKRKDENGEEIKILNDDDDHELNNIDSNKKTKHSKIEMFVNNDDNKIYGNTPINSAYDDNSWQNE